MQVNFKQTHVGGGTLGQASAVLQEDRRRDLQQLEQQLEVPYACCSLPQNNCCYCL